MSTMRRVGKAKACPPFQDEAADGWWARRKGALAHPTESGAFDVADSNFKQREAFEVTSPRVPLVMPREGGASSKQRLLGSITDASGILVHPPEPVIRPAKGRTGWRVMTIGE